MNRRTLLQIAGLAGASTLLSGCGWNDSSWNQKITVTVDTPHGPVSGSAVTYIAWSENQVFKDGARWQLEYKGEAVVVDLGAGKYLFALLSSGLGRGGDIGLMGLQSIGLNENQGNEFRYHKGMIPIKSELYPILVTFTDISDPKSVKEVRPSDLAATFGEGFSLRSITLEITNEPVTQGVVEKVLPWVVNLQGGIDKTQFDVNADPVSEKAKKFLRNINDGSFRQGFSQ